MPRFSNFVAQPVRSGFSQGVDALTQQINKNTGQQRQDQLMSDQQARQDELLKEQREYTAGVARKSFLDRMDLISAEKGLFAAKPNKVTATITPTTQQVDSQIEYEQIGEGLSERDRRLMFISDRVKENKNKQLQIQTLEQNRKLAIDAAKQMKNPQLIRSVTLSNDPLKTLAEHEISVSQDPSSVEFQNELDVIHDLVNSGNSTAGGAIDKLASNPKYTALMENEAIKNTFTSLRKRSQGNLNSRPSAGFTDARTVLFGSGAVELDSDQGAEVKLLESKLDSIDTFTGKESSDYNSLLSFSDTIDRAKNDITKVPGWQKNFGLAKSLWEDVKDKFNIGSPEYKQAATQINNMISNVYQISGKQLSDGEIKLVLSAFVPTIKTAAENYVAVSDVLSRIYRKNAGLIQKRANNQGRFLTLQEVEDQELKAINASKKRIESGDYSRGPKVVRFNSEGEEIK